MKRLKTFFKYFLIITIFFIVSNILVFVIANTRYNPITCNITSSHYEITGSAKTSNIDVLINLYVENKEEVEQKSKYLKIEGYTKRDVEVITKYIEIGKLEPSQKKEIEIGLQQSKVTRIEISVVEQIPNNIEEKNKLSDGKMSLGTWIGALITLSIIL